MNDFSEAHVVQERIPHIVSRRWELFSKLIKLEPSLSDISSPDEYRQRLLGKEHSPTFVELYAIGLAFGAHLRVARGGKFIDICPDNVHTVVLIHNSVDDSYSPPNSPHIPLPSAFAAIPPAPPKDQSHIELPAAADPSQLRHQQTEPYAVVPRCIQQLQSMRPSLVTRLLESNLAEDDFMSIRHMVGLSQEAGTQSMAESQAEGSSVVAVASAGSSSGTTDDGGPIAAGATADARGANGMALPDVLGLMKCWKDIGRGVLAQPVLAEEQSDSGDQFYILGIIDTPQRMLLDTGSSYSLIHREKALSLGGEIIPAPHNVVRTINGAMAMNSKVSFVVDFIVCKLQIEFLIAADPNYHSDMIIIGSPALQAYNVVVDCENFTLNFADSLRIPMIPDTRTAEEHMRFLTTNFVSLVGFEVIMQKDVIVEPESLEFVDYKPSRETADRVNGVYIHFEAERMQQAQVYLYDLLIGPEFDWSTQTLRLPVRNKSAKRILVRQGKQLGLFKTVVDPERAGKLNSLPSATFSTLVPHAGGGAATNTHSPQGGTSAMGVFSVQPTGVENMEVAEAENWDPLSEEVEIPEWLREKLDKDNAEIPEPRCDMTQIVPRDDFDEDHLEKLVTDNQRAVEAYWDERGKEALLSKIALAKDLTPQQIERVNNITWAHRCIMGAKLEHLAAGLRHYAVDMAYDPALVTAAAPRPMSLFQRELLTEYLKTYVRANILEASTSTPLSNCFLVEKKNNRIKSREDLKKATPEDLAASFRLVVDMAHITPAVRGFQAEMLGMPRFLSFLRPGRRFLTLDGFQYFYQVSYTLRSRPLTAIHCGGDTKSFQRACMGTTSSSGTTQRIGELIFDNVDQMEKLFHADNFNFHKATVDEIIDLYEENLGICVKHNLLLKPEEISIGENFEDDTEFTMLGYSFRNGRVFPPARKVSEYKNLPLPTTYRKIKAIVCSLSFFRCLSPTFAKYHYDLSTEVQRQRDASSRFSLTPEMVRNLRFLLHMVVHSNGLSLLKDIDVNNNAFCVFSDASDAVFGAVLTVLRGNKMVAIYAVSRCLPLSQRSFCSNRKEAIAAHHSLVLLAPFLKFKKFFLITDSAFVYNALRSPIKTLPSPIRSYLASMREEFTFRTLLCRSQDNLADVMTRFTTFEEPLDTSSQLDCHLYLQPKEALSHMADQTLDDSTAAELHDMNASFAQSLHDDVEDVITKSVTDEAPLCFAAEAVLDVDFSPNVGDEACNAEGTCCAMEPSTLPECGVATRSMTKSATDLLHQLEGGRIARASESAAKIPQKAAIARQAQQEGAPLVGDAPMGRLAKKRQTLGSNDDRQSPMDGSDGIDGERAVGGVKEAMEMKVDCEATHGFGPVSIAGGGKCNLTLTLPQGSGGVLVTPVVVQGPSLKTEVSSVEGGDVEAAARKMGRPQESDDAQFLEPIEPPNHSPGTMSANAVFPLDDDTLEFVRDFTDGEPGSLNHVLHESKHLFGTVGPVAMEESPELPKLRVDVSHGQAMDDDIVAIVALIEQGAEVQPHQAYHRSPFFNDLFKRRDNLKVKKGILYYTSIQNNGEVYEAMVVPGAMRKKFLDEIHRGMSHVNPVKLEKMVQKSYHKVDIRKLAHEVFRQCEECRLGQDATTAKGRSIPCHAFKPDICWHVDLLQMPSEGGFNYLVVFCDVYSRYIFGRQIRHKTAAEVATALTDIVLERQVAPRFLCHDLGLEFQNQIMDLLAQSVKTMKIALRPSQKNANLAESTHSRLLAVMRRNFENTKSWRNLWRQVVFAINVAEMRVGEHEILSPLELYTGKAPEILPVVPGEGAAPTTEFHFRRIQQIREILEMICKYRNIHSDLLIVTDENQTYAVGETVMIWREFVQKAKLAKVRSLEHKLITRWEKAEVLQKVGDCYLVQPLGSGRQRVVHRRTMKKWLMSST